jgi:hypothetical protein
MRETQYIGLTKLAEDYVSNLKELESDTSTFGMFDEDIPLRRWEMPEDYKYNREGECIREVVQATPWSSGPMIFTCLEFDFGNGGKVIFCQWIDYPNIKDQECDREKGMFWV